MHDSVGHTCREVFFVEPYASLAADSPGRTLLRAAAAAGTIAERFEQAVRRQPGSTAVRFRGRAVSYAELSSSAAGLAGRLAERGVPAGSRVGICLERGPAAITAILATLRAACAYVPLDPDLPRARLAAMAGVSGVSAVIADEANGSRIRATLRDCMVMDVADPAADHSRERGARLLAGRCPQPRDIAYIACTSGSTGGPKPVAVSHAQVLGMYEAWETVYRLDEVTRHLQMAALGFDVFTGDLLRALLSGGTLVISPKEATLDPAALYELLRSEQIQCAEFVPATFRPLARYVSSIGAALDFMRFIIVGSDRWTALEYEAACQLAGAGAEIVNSYGKTEAAVDSTALFSRDWVPPGDGTVPIGRPLRGVEVYIVGRGLELVQYGQVGELAIGGVGVSYGYPGDPRLTASVFPPDPFSGRPGARLHLTGDLARWGPAGLMLAGRSDEQVKIRGVRIEPGEVEAALSSHPAVRDAAVVARPGPAGEPMLVGYMTPSTVNPAAVRSHAARHLPPVAVPAVVAVDSLPVTANGKVDRRALAGRALPARRPVAPHGDPVTRQVAAIWCEILGESGVHAEDDFYMIGGNSLLGAQVAVKLRAAFRIRVSLWVTEKNRTLDELAGWVREELKRNQDAPRRGADHLAAAAAADVVVTGGTGGAGSFIVRALARRGYAVAAAGREESADAAAAAGAVWFIPTDLADATRLTDLARHANAIIHAAWMFPDPDGSVAAMTALLAGWSAGPFTFISTTDVYDPDPGPYAAAKAFCERALAAAAGDRPWTALRPGHVWGPHERFASQLRWADLRWLVEPLLQGAAVYVPGPDPAGARRYGDGWIGVRDLAAAAAASLEQPARRPVDAVAGHFTWLGLARTLAAELGSASRVVLRDPAGDPHATRWRCDPGQLPALLGVTPEHRRYRQSLREVISHAAGGVLAAAAGTVPPPQTGDDRDWKAVVNGEGQFSVWLAGRPLPPGWHDTVINGSRAHCLDRIAEIWPDSLPRAARRSAAVAVRERRPGPGQPTAAHARTYLMCPPEHFTVAYAINPWMRPRHRVDQARAMRQWQALHATLASLGHAVHTADPLPGLPDMVFAANGATVIAGTVLAARFRYPQRGPEAHAYLQWLTSHGCTAAVQAAAANEGQGDIIAAGQVILLGHGYRTDAAAVAEVESAFGLPVVSLRLVDPWFYHLDTALCVLGPGAAAYYPPAFDEASRDALASHFPLLIEAKQEDAEVLGLNAIGDGQHIVMPTQAASLAGQITSLGFEPVLLDMSEFLLAGGGPKCCVLDLGPSAAGVNS